MGPENGHEATTDDGAEPIRRGGPAWVISVPESDLDDDCALGVEVAGQAICLVRSDGEVYALIDECSHGQVALSEGEVVEGCIECWLHGSRFDLTTGVPTGPPATVPVPVYPVRIVDGCIQIFIDADDSDG